MVRPPASEICTKLAKKYKELNDLTTQLTQMKEAFNLDAKQHILQYFNAEDEVLTRVVKTVSLTLTLSKKTVRRTETTNLEGFYQELLILLPELADKLKVLRDKYTKIENVETSPGLRVKLPGDVEESINEATTGIWAKIEDFGNRLLKIFKVWGKQYDHKLETLKQKVESFAVGESLAQSLDVPLKEESFRPDFEGLIYEVGEIKNLADETADGLLNLQHFASIECQDESLARKFKELYFDAAKIKKDLFSIGFDLREKNKLTNEPVSEELEDTHENMLDLAKMIRNYVISPGKIPKVEDRVSLMLFAKKVPLKNLSLFAILGALQELPKEAHQEIADLVRG